MRNRLGILIVIVLVGVCGWISWLSLRHQKSEPVYQGKTLSAWLNEANPRTSLLTDTAAEAVRHMGTNAVPYLLQQLGAPESPVNELAASLLEKQSFLKLKLPSKYQRQLRAQRGICALGELGALALTEGLTNSAKWVRVGCASTCQTHQEYSTIFIHPLLASLKDKEPLVRAQAAFSLGSF
ncbi:MAG TPA: hypothetical protein VEC99_05275, partial [Clostridia bacterium]|nr:hypothetical protein [Clostridia bacterium]